MRPTLRLVSARPTMSHPCAERTTLVQHATGKPSRSPMLLAEEGWSWWEAAVLVLGVALVAGLGWVLYGVHATNDWGLGTPPEVRGSVEGPRGDVP